jgi:hypothetical protein
MHIDLKNLKTYWINLSKDVDKHFRMSKMFTELGMENTSHFEGIVLDPSSHIKDGSGMATHTLLTKIYDADDFPCLVLEDDAKDTKTFSLTYNVPDECDALYLGVSRAGARGHQALLTVYNDDYFRVWNMLATHAVVYFSKKYVKNILDQGIVFLNKNIPYDIGIAELHCNYNILTPEYPAFYQYDPQKTSKFDVEWYTKYQIAPVRGAYKNIEFNSNSTVLGDYK